MNQGKKQRENSIAFLYDSSTFWDEMNRSVIWYLQSIYTGWVHFQNLYTRVCMCTHTHICIITWLSRSLQGECFLSRFHESQFLERGKDLTLMVRQRDGDDMKWNYRLVSWEINHSSRCCCQEPNGPSGSSEELRTVWIFGLPSG